MSEFMSSVSVAALKEIVKVLEANGGKAVITALVEKGFDKFVAPIDLPGPDALIDPLLRKMIAPVVSAIYDAIVAKAAVLDAGK